MSKYLAISIAIVMLIIGIGIGYIITPQYALQANSGTDGMGMVSLGRSDTKVDLRYLNAMITHHRGAMLLAEQVKDKTRRQEIQSLAEAILADEPKNISELYQWKKAWYKDASKVKDPKVANLGEYDDKLDLRLLNALIAHHQDGLDMNKEIRLKTSRTEVLNSADATDNFFNTTKAKFIQWRSEWYGIK